MVRSLPLLSAVGGALVLPLLLGVPTPASASPVKLDLGSSFRSFVDRTVSLSSKRAGTSSSVSNGGSGEGGAGAIQDGDFVKVNGLKLKDSKGQDVYITGMNYWACMNLAADDSAGGNQTRFLAEMDQMAVKGINHLRIMASSEGAPTTQPNRMYPALMPSPYHWNEEIFVGLDRCIAEMGKRGMRATMTLANTWNWSGGMGQYVSWVKNNETIPYPPSWDPYADPQPWGNYTTNGSWNGYTDYANQFYNTSETQDIFRAHIANVVNRKNTVTGKTYKDDPARAALIGGLDVVSFVYPFGLPLTFLTQIMTWELANEPQPAVQYNTSTLQLLPNPNDPLLTWINSTSAYIHSIAPNQLVTTGAEGKQGEWYWKAMHKFSTIDYGCAHMWVQNWGIYNMLDSSKGNLQNAKDFATVFLYNTSQWAIDLNKPVLLEEFGMARDNWENNALALQDHNKTYIYASNATTMHKDSYFTFAFANVLHYFYSGKGYIGSMPWAYGGIWRPEALYRNEYNEAWAGDPPHEAPGWYDVYDTDYALDLILWQSQNASYFIKNGKPPATAYGGADGYNATAANATLANPGSASNPPTMAASSDSSAAKHNGAFSLVPGAAMGALVTIAALFFALV